MFVTSGYSWLRSAISVKRFEWESGAREETGGFGDVKFKSFCRGLGSNRVSGTSLLCHNHWTTAARYQWPAPQSFVVFQGSNYTQKAKKPSSKRTRTLLCIEGPMENAGPNKSKVLSIWCATYGSVWVLEAFQVRTVVSLAPQRTTLSGRSQSGGEWKILSGILQRINDSDSLRSRVTPHNSQTNSQKKIVDLRSHRWATHPTSNWIKKINADFFTTNKLQPPPPPTSQTSIVSSNKTFRQQATDCNRLDFTSPCD